MTDNTERQLVTSLCVFFVSHLRPINLNMICSNPTSCKVVIRHVVTKDFPNSPRFLPTILYRDASSATLAPRQPMVEFCLFTFSIFPSILYYCYKTEIKTDSNHPLKNRTHEIRTSKTARLSILHSLFYSNSSTSCSLCSSST